MVMNFSNSKYMIFSSSSLNERVYIEKRNFDNKNKIKVLTKCRKRYKIVTDTRESKYK